MQVYPLDSTGALHAFIPKESVCGVFAFTKPSFFHLLTETGVASMFLKAVTSDTEAARTFVSKNCIIDLDALRNVLESSLCCSGLVTLKKAALGQGKNGKKRSILLGNKSCILHLRMVEEPDRFGQWKIYDVEKE